MTQATQARPRKRLALWIILATLAVLLAVLIVPSRINIGRYRGRITQLISSSLGRPVRLSSVEMRLLPRPGFVLTDLTVDEDPAYGAEPLLHASTVSASIRIASLFRGHLEIGRISVDEASLNLVRARNGHWNLDPLFRTAAGHAVSGAAPARRSVVLPYLEATNSRINLIEGTEKLPFSLLNTDLSLEQERPGEWRVELRGQPARTDVSLDLADTGILRLQGNIHPASELRQMPLHLDVVWREAQLGQLARLLTGSDPGWRGALTGDLHIEGTAEAAQVKARLRAEGVHRAEFAPANTLDFDANCALVYHFTSRSAENLTCDSPLGNGRMRLTGSIPGEGSPQLSMELFRIPVDALLDSLRTMRSGFGEGLEARGTVSGKVSYAEVPVEIQVPAKRGKSAAARTHPVPAGPLSGSFVVEGFRLSGNGLSTPIQAAKVVFEPAPPIAGEQNPEPALAATLPIPAGGVGPLNVTARLAHAGYSVTVRGQASIARGRELAHAAGVLNVAGLDALAGDPVSIDLTLDGPWRPEQPAPFSIPPAAGAPVLPAPAGTTDHVNGTIALRTANWKSDYLANRVQISQAVLHIGDSGMRWDPVAFAFGPVKGAAVLSIPPGCAAPAPCPASFELQFGTLDAAALQAAILGARESGTLISTLIERLRPAATPVWPLLDGTIKADAFVLGPVTLQDMTATVHVTQNAAEIEGLQATLFGGSVAASGTLQAPGDARQDKPAYALTGHFEKLNAAAVGQLIGLRWAGGAIDADGKLTLEGYTGSDLADSAKGTLHFEARHGVLAAASGANPVPAALARFDRWTADAEIGGGKIVVQQNVLQQGPRTKAVEVSVTLADPAKTTFPASRPTAPAKR